MSSRSAKHMYAKRKADGIINKLQQKRKRDNVVSPILWNKNEIINSTLDNRCTRPAIDNIPTEISSSSGTFEVSITHDELYINTACGAEENTVECKNCNNSYEKNDPNLEYNIRKDLRAWVIDCNVNHMQLDKLLKIMRKYYPSLPKSSKSIMKGRGSYSMQPMLTSRGTQGMFTYFGIKSSLLPILEELNSPEVNLIINIDGVPIYKSRNSQLWPVLGHIYQSRYKPFVIALYYGDSKPSSLDDYLQLFIEECCSLYSGFTYNSIHYRVKVLYFVCDAPARAFLKAIKGHNSYYGCEKCEVLGKRVDNRMVYTNFDAPLRTDDSFACQSNKAHHNGITPLLKIPYINIIDAFFLDYMHMSCLGIMKRLLFIWIKIRRTEHSVSQQNILELNNIIENIIPYIPSEFQRKPRAFTELEHWKATEFRFFILYLGPALLKNILSLKKYKNFLHFHIAMRIMCSNNLLYYDLIAQAYIEKFFSNFLSLYGEAECIYNIHSIVHLIKDAVRLKVNLNDVSSFRFENHLGELKRLIHGPNKPLQQLTRRLLERQFSKGIASRDNIKILKEENGQITSIKFKNYTICVNHKKDRYIVLEKNKILEVSKILKGITTASYELEGYIYQDVIDAYSLSQIKSKNLHYYLINNIHNKVMFRVSLDKFVTKCCVFPCNNKLYAVGMLHE